MAMQIASLAFNSSLYHIWKERNQRHFNNVSRLKKRIVEDIVGEVNTKIKNKTMVVTTAITCHLVKEWNLDVLNGDLAVQKCVWPKQDENTWVLSTDASMTPNRAGYGGLLCNGAGDTVFCFAGKTEVKHILWLELHALWRGLVLVHARNIERITVYLDSKLAVDILNGVIKCPWRVMSLVSKIKSILNDFSRIHVIHVWREANQLADFLARWATIFEEKILLPFEFPKELREKIIKDESQCNYTRL